MVIATTSSPRILADMEMKQMFKIVQRVPQLTKPEHVQKVFETMQVPVERDELPNIASSCAFPIGVKQLIEVIEMARQTGSNMTKARFMECLSAKGLFTRDPTRDVVELDDDFKTQ